MALLLAEQRYSSLSAWREITGRLVGTLFFGLKRNRPAIAVLATSVPNRRRDGEQQCAG